MLLFFQASALFQLKCFDNAASEPVLPMNWNCFTLLQIFQKNLICCPQSRWSSWDTFPPPQICSGIHIFHFQDSGKLRNKVHFLSTAMAMTWVCVVGELCFKNNLRIDLHLLWFWVHGATQSRLRTLNIEFQPHVLLSVLHILNMTMERPHRYIRFFKI